MYFSEQSRLRCDTRTLKLTPMERHARAAQELAEVYFEEDRMIRLVGVRVSSSTSSRGHETLV